MSEKANIAELIEFPEGDIKANADGTIQFRFRSMDYVSARGRDSTEFMGITIGKETADEIKGFFRKVYGY